MKHDEKENFLQRYDDCPVKYFFKILDGMTFFFTTYFGPNAAEEYKRQWRNAMLWRKMDVEMQERESLVFTSGSGDSRPSVVSWKMFIYRRRMIEMARNLEDKIGELYDSYATSHTHEAKCFYLIEDMTSHYQYFKDMRNYIMYNLTPYDSLSLA